LRSKTQNLREIRENLRKQSQETLSTKLLKI